MCISSLSWNLSGAASRSRRARRKSRDIPRNCVGCTPRRISSASVFVARTLTRHALGLTVVTVLVDVLYPHLIGTHPVLLLPRDNPSEHRINTATTAPTAPSPLHPSRMSPVCPAPKHSPRSARARLASRPARVVHLLASAPRVLDRRRPRVLIMRSSWPMVTVALLRRVRRCM